MPAVIESQIKDFPPRKRDDNSIVMDKDVCDVGEVTDSNDNIDSFAPTETNGGNALFVIKINSQLTQIGMNCSLKWTGHDNLRENENDQEFLSQSSDTDQDHEKTKKPTRKSKKRRLKAAAPDCTQFMKTIGPAELSPTGKAFIAMSDDIMKALQVFRDNGKWIKFEEKKREMCEKYSGNWEAQMMIRLEQCVALCYQNKLDESEHMMSQAHTEIAEINSENAASLTRRCKLYMSGVYRKMPNQTGLADHYTTEAEHVYPGHGITLDDTFIVYERASVLMDFISKCPRNNNTGLKDKAKACLKQCIDWSMKLEGDVANIRYVNKHQFALIKIAMLVLDCRTTAGRKKDMNDQCAINEAKDCLQTLYTKYWDGIATGEKIQYYLAEADLHWRQRNYPQAKASASRAYNMAVEFGFKTEVDPARDRLDEIENKLHQVYAGDSQLDLCVSDNDLGDVSSSCESDDLSVYGSL